MADRRQRTDAPERHALLERVSCELERVADREGCLLDSSNDGQELPGGVQPGGCRVAPAVVGRLDR